MENTFVEVLEARADLREARRSVAEGDDPSRARRRALDRTLASMAVRDAEGRLQRASGELARMLDIPAEDAGRIMLSGALRDDSPAPPIAVLLHIALSCRADLVAQRLSIDRAQALVRMEKSRSIRDTYILDEPWNYEVGQTNQGERGANTWALALFAPLPMFDRNQGNIQRARLEVSKMQVAVAHVEGQVGEEVRAAFDAFRRTLDDQRELAAEVLPVVREDLDEAGRALRAGRIGDADYRDARREYDAAMRVHREAVVRHRRGVTRLNTSVGRRIVPSTPPDGTTAPTLIRRAGREAGDIARG